MAELGGSEHDMGYSEADVNESIGGFEGGWQGNVYAAPDLPTGLTKGIALDDLSGDISALPPDIGGLNTTQLNSFLKQYTYLPPSVKNFLISIVPSFIMQAKNIKGMFDRADKAAKYAVSLGMFPDEKTAKSYISAMMAADRQKNTTDIGATGGKEGDVEFYNGLAAWNSGLGADQIADDTEEITPTDPWKAYVQNFFGVGKPGDEGYIKGQLDRLTDAAAFEQAKANKYLQDFANITNEQMAGYGPLEKKYKTQMEGITPITVGFKGASKPAASFISRPDRDIMSSYKGLIDDIAGSRGKLAALEMGLTDVLNPERAGLSYNKELGDLGKWSREVEAKIAQSQQALDLQAEAQEPSFLGALADIGTAGMGTAKLLETLGIEF